MCKPQSKRRLPMGSADRAGGPPAPLVPELEPAARRVLSHGVLLKEVLAFAASAGYGGLDAARCVSRAWRAAVERWGGA